MFERGRKERSAGMMSILMKAERQTVGKIHESRGRIEHELAKVIVGQKEGDPCSF